MKTRVAVAGCAGRMGRALVQALVEAEDLQLAAASEAPGSPALGADAGTLAGLAPLGVEVTDDPAQLVAAADAVVDFSAPAASAEMALRCAGRGLPLVLGTTGLGAAEREKLEKAARRIPLVFAANMSVGVNVLLRLCAEAACLLGPGYAIEIIEAHHDRKADAPSGTALRLAEVLAEATGGGLERRVRHGRQGQIGPRHPEEIGIHAVRGGDIVGEHTIYFCTPGERLELTHRASSRRTFAAGALRALRWARGRGPGLYDMQQVLGLKPC